VGSRFGWFLLLQTLTDFILHLQIIQRNHRNTKLRLSRSRKHQDNHQRLEIHRIYRIPAPTTSPRTLACVWRCLHDSQGRQNDEISPEPSEENRIIILVPVHTHTQADRWRETVRKSLSLHEQRIDGTTKASITLRNVSASPKAFKVRPSGFSRLVHPSGGRIERHYHGCDCLRSSPQANLIPPRSTNLIENSEDRSVIS
jgi:hypothetical protein